MISHYAKNSILKKQLFCIVKSEKTPYFRSNFKQKV